MARIHMIAVGGSVMHNLALALKDQGHEVSGSDDQIYEPARSRLTHAGILPKEEGWDPQKIHRGIDFVILGMHAKAGNPELEAAQSMGIPVYSFPEYVGKVFQGKKQIVIGGSHGKTTTTAMLMHIFKSLDLDFDYLVGAQLDGFRTMVRLSDAPFALIEGDEYLSSCLDVQPKFMHYNPTVLILTGVAWDHYNVFPKFELYLEAFQKRIDSLQEGSHLVYYAGDPHLSTMAQRVNSRYHVHPYREATAHVSPNGYSLHSPWGDIPLEIFGNHNLQNLQAAFTACGIFNLNLKEAYFAARTFKGAAKRLELIHKSDRLIVYRDFAHAPSKLQATLEALRQRYPTKRILAVVELHTYSSLNKEFLPNYSGTVDQADACIVFIDQKALEIKNLNPPDPNFLKEAFGFKNLIVLPDPVQLTQEIKQHNQQFDILLFAGSGQFGGMDLHASFSEVEPLPSDSEELH